MNIDSKFKEDEGTNNKESGKIDNNEQKPEDQVTSAKITTQEDGTDNKESGKSNDKISIKKEVFEDEEPGGSSPKYSFEDETCINYNTFDSDERRQPINTDESHTGGMRLRNFETLENTVNSRKRYQNQDEGLDDNELYLLKKIKTEDTSDDPFQEMWTNNFDHNSLNFEEWEKILNFVDEKNDIVNVRTVYTKFLGLYPLCYGYWKKYANFEKINNNMDEFEKVLEKGLIAIPISVDLWIYYMTYLRTNRSDEVVHIRNEFERSLKSCGLDYHSDQLWHDYISWEVEKTELYNAAQLYYRLICIPNSNYLNNFFEFQEFIFTKLPEQYLEHEEFNKRRNIIIQSLETTHNNIESSFYESIPPGEDFHKNTEFTEDRIMFLLRVGIINEWRDSHNETGMQFESRKIFEENIRRPHFHVNELDSNQIKNWDNYIKFERRIGRNHERIVYLYERCLITCVYNEEFWLNYLEYLSIVKNIDVTDLLSDVFMRSLSYHPKSLLLNLKYIDFCETQGLENIADETIRQLGVDYPDSMEVSIKNFNLARKYNSLKTVYEHYLSFPQSKSFFSYIAVRYARFVWKHDRQLNLAHHILSNAVKNNDISVNDSLEIYTTLVELEMELSSKDLVLNIIDNLILQCHLYKEKLVFSKKKIEYAEDYIQDYELLRLAKMEHKHLKSECFRERRQLTNNAM